MIKKINFWFRFLTQLLKRYGLLLTAGILTGAGLFLAANRLILLASRLLPKTKKIGIVGKYNLSTLPPRISHLISYGLTEILPNSRATSSPIISGWTIKPEGKEYIFFLNPNTRWQDETKLTANQINYQISGAEVSAIEKGVKISLKSSFAPLLSFLNQPIFKNNQIGLGPHKIKKINIKGGNFSSLLLANTNNLKERTLFRFYPNEKELITAFKLSEISEAWEISDIETFSSWQNVSIKTERANIQKYVALFFNTRKDPFSSKRIRQGLSYAIQKPLKTDRAISPISPSSWAYNEKVKTYRFDPDHAKNILEKEDWEPEEDFSIQLYTLPQFLGWAEKIQKDWQENLNISSEIHVSSFIPNQEDFDVFLGFGIIPSDPDQYFFWHSTQHGNLTGINSPRIDQLLEKGRKTIDLEERKQIYYEFQRALSEEVAAVFLFYLPSYTISKN